MNMSKVTVFWGVLFYFFDFDLIWARKWDFLFSSFIASLFVKWISFSERRHSNIGKKSKILRNMCFGLLNGIRTNFYLKVNKILSYVYISINYFILLD